MVLLRSGRGRRVDGLVLVNGGGGLVDALDATTGALQWRFEPLAGLDGFARRRASGPVATGSTLYLTAPSMEDVPQHSYFYALDLGSGVARWIEEVPGRPVSRPLLHDGSGYVAVKVGGIEVVEGVVRSRAEHLAVRSVALDSGTIRWEATIDSAWQVSDPLLVADRLVIATDRGTVAFDFDTGEEVWRFRTSEHFVKSTFWVAGDEVLVGTQESLHVLDAATGEVRRAIALKEGWVHGIEGDDVYLSHLERLSRHDLTTGQWVWESKLDSRPGQIREIDGWLYLTTNGEHLWGSKPKTGYLYKLNPETGKQ